MLEKLNFGKYCIICILFFFCVNHFSGFEQDCVLYTLQAINRIAPERFIGDPAFMLGNQDSFSLFSPFYGLFIRLLPIDSAAFVVGALIHGLFAFFVATLLWWWNRVFHGKILLLPVALCFFSLYAYGEARNELAFCTKIIESVPVPRTLSAAIGFLGLAFFFEKKWVSLGVIVLGTLIHPLTAGWCLPIWALFYFRKLRITLIVLSALFPLTILIGKDPWVESSEGWIKNSLENGMGEQLGRMAIFLLFFWVALKTISMPQVFKKFLTCFNIVLTIAFYWFVIALFAHHVFLYQVQTYRIQWICQILAVLISVGYIYQIYVSKIQSKRNLGALEKLLLGVILVLWIDCPYFVVLSICTILFFKARGTRFFKVFETGMLIASVAGVLLICFNVLELVPCVKPEYVYADKLFCLHPFIAMLSVVVLSLAIFVPNFRLTAVAMLAVVLLSIMNAWRILPRENFSIAYVLGSLLFIATYLRWSNQKVLKVCMTMAVAFMIVCIFLFFDCRDEQQKSKEKAMNQFVQTPPFPSILNRGQIFYSVRNYGDEIPRLRFLSGGYYDFQIGVGSIFSKPLKQEIDRREWSIYKSGESIDSNWEELSSLEKFQKCWNIVLNKDSLPITFRRLCRQNEVTHLVADEKMPLAAQDSLILWYNGEKIWLYACD